MARHRTSGAVNIRRSASAILNKHAAAALEKTGAQFVLLASLDGALHVIPITEEGVIGIGRLTSRETSGAFLWMGEAVRQLAIAPGTYSANWKQGSLEIDLSHTISAAQRPRTGARPRPEVPLGEMLQ
jgi:hypothetical protein